VAFDSGEFIRNCKTLNIRAVVLVAIVIRIDSIIFIGFLIRAGINNFISISNLKIMFVLMGYFLAITQYCNFTNL